MPNAAVRGHRPPIRADEFRDQILAKEFNAIEVRRKANKIEPRLKSDTVGLALSGGGIRSAAFCFGALQALNQVGAYPSIDYLSTVSGGGYAGAALTSTMRKKSEFVFGYPGPGRNDAPLDAVHNRNEPRAVRHIRDNSNFLLPRGGWRDQPINILIVIRGLLVNALGALTILLFLACLTLLSLPNEDRLVSTYTVWLGYAPWAAMAAGLLLLAWALFHSFAPRCLEVNHCWRVLAMVAGYLALLALALPYNLMLIAWLWCDATQTHASVLHYIPNIGVIWTTIVAISGGVAAFSGRIGKILTIVPLSPPGGAGAWRLYAKRAALWAALVVASLPVPLSLYACYVTLVLWGLPNDLAAPQASAPLFLFPRTPEWLNCQGCSATALNWISAFLVVWVLFWAIERTILTVLFGTTPGRVRRWIAANLTGPFGTALGRVGTWIADINNPFGSLIVAAVPVVIVFLFCPVGALGGLVAALVSNKVALAYLPWLGIAFGLTWLFKPNANSLHPLYRDRIRNAFLFKPWVDVVGQADTDKGWQDPPRWDSDKLSDYENCKGPYPLINATVNLRGSQHMNRRGRDADFFVFTPHFVGSDATGYAKTRYIEKADPGLDLATAVAISGAAISANMGTRSIRQLTLTLALLNIRLGYWLTNPKYAINRCWHEHFQDGSNVYLVLEALGLLKEKSAKVYLTDGGHIDNLGLFQLLKRRCQLIIVIDAEADPNYNFTSFVELQRYARIELGVRIKLPWEDIRDEARKIDALLADGRLTKEQTDEAKKNGKHAAIGTIHYPRVPGDDAERTGLIVYFKASVTGDEYDEVLAYKRRSPGFPHETTGDQFFNEEHFEVYRSLGCHAVLSLLHDDLPYAARLESDMMTKTHGQLPIDWVRRRLQIWSTRYA